VAFSLVHLSDLHFNAYPEKLSEWNFKRALGAANLFLKRARKHPLSRNRLLVEHVSNLQWDHLVISGDLTQLGLEQEFEQARKELDPLLQEKNRVSIIPGNHDRYVAESRDKDFFGQYFSEFFGEDDLHHRDLACGWKLIGWDSCHPAPWYSASGTVNHSSLKHSESLFKESDPESPFILVNHYPIHFPEDRNPDPHHELSNLESVREWVLEQPQIRLYLHGHIHQNWILKSHRQEGPELVQINSAASSQVLKPGQKSSFHQIQIEGDALEVLPILLAEA